MVESIAIGCSRRLLDDGPIRLANAATDGLLVNVKSDVVHVEHGISSASVSIAERYGVDGTGGRPQTSCKEHFFALASFPFSLGIFRNGPEPSRARGLCVAEENLFRF